MHPINLAWLKALQVAWCNNDDKSIYADSDCWFDLTSHMVIPLNEKYMFSAHSNLPTAMARAMSVLYNKVIHMPFSPSAVKHFKVQYHFLTMKQEIYCKFYTI